MSCRTDKLQYIQTVKYSLVIEDVITTTCTNKDKSRKYNVEQKKPDTRINAI